MAKNNGSVDTVTKEIKQGFCDFQAGYSIGNSACGGKLILRCEDEHYQRTQLELTPVQAYELAQQLMRSATEVQMTSTKIAC